MNFNTFKKSIGTKKTAIAVALTSGLVGVVLNSVKTVAAQTLAEKEEIIRGFHRTADQGAPQVQQFLAEQSEKFGYTIDTKTISEWSQEIVGNATPSATVGGDVLPHVTESMTTVVPVSEGLPLWVEVVIIVGVAVFTAIGVYFVASRKRKQR